jgi:hypothetical protein
MVGIKNQMHAYEMSYKCQLDVVMQKRTNPQHWQFSIIGTSGGLKVLLFYAENNQPRIAMCLTL